MHTSGKYRNAKAKGITILDEDGFEKLIRDLSGISTFEISNRKEMMKQLGADPPKLRKSLSLDDQGNAIPSTEMWTDLYKPDTIMDLVGNEGTINQLFEWLKDWDDVHIRGNKKLIKAPRFDNWQDIPRINAAAAMLSGPPGIGKTSAARIICKQLGYEVLELNASDVRNKVGVEHSIGVLSDNHCLDYWTVAGLKKAEAEKNPTVEEFGGQNTCKSVIIMDEVDGCGSGDRGGINALIQIIKKTKTPIICICNDRQNRKLQTLITYCFDLKFQKPTEKAIKSRILQII